MHMCLRELMLVIISDSYIRDICLIPSVAFASVKMPNM